MKRLLIGLFVIFLWMLRPDPTYQLDVDDIYIVEFEGFEIGGLELYGLTLYSVIFITPEAKKDKTFFEHEYVHVVQQRREGLVFFVKYLYYFGSGLIARYHMELDQAWKEAYYAIPYEIEAFDKEKAHLKDGL